MEGLTIWECAVAAKNRAQAGTSANNLQEILMAAKAYIIVRDGRSADIDRAR
jgi:hypothetical protein